MAEEERIRLFAAMELPQAWHDVLGGLRADLERLAPREFKWVRPDLLHLTLVFLGYQPADALANIEAAMTAAATQVPPFLLALGSPGYFGPPHGLQVIWVGLADTPPELQRLHQALTTQLSGAAVPFDRKPLVPHITLARGRRPTDRAASLRVHSALQRVRLPAGLSTSVEEFVLMQSRLSRLGPEYRVVDRFQLGGGDG